MRAYNGRRIDRSQPPAATRKGFSMGVKMFEYLRLADDTQVSYSEPREDGTVLVCVEQPIEMGFNSAWCILPACKWLQTEGFSPEQLRWYEQFVRNNAPVIMNFAWEGGFAHA